jgi:serine/threonine protein kinase
LRNDLADPFIASLDDPTQLDSDSTELRSAIEKLKRSRVNSRHSLPMAMERLNGTEIGRTDSSIVTLARKPSGRLVAIKAARTSQSAELIRRESLIHSRLKHPLVLEFHCCENTSIVTDFAANGTLASHLPWQGSPTQITRIIVGIVLAMRYVHSHEIIHRDLKPTNILLDWDCNVRIADFGHSLSPELRDTLSLSQTHEVIQWPSVDCHYLAPECYANDYPSRSDTFSFGLILYEIIVGTPALAREWMKPLIAKLLGVEQFRPCMPDFVAPAVRALIMDCWADDPDDRPCFEEILERLEDMEFRICPGVNSTKVTTFVKKVQEQEQIDEDLWN